MFVGSALQRIIGVGYLRTRTARLRIWVASIRAAVGPSAARRIRSLGISWPRPAPTRGRAVLVDAIWRRGSGQTWKMVPMDTSVLVPCAEDRLDLVGHSHGAARAAWLGSVRKASGVAARRKRGGWLERQRWCSGWILHRGAAISLDRDGTGGRDPPDRKVPRSSILVAETPQRIPDRGKCGRDLGYGRLWPDERIPCWGSSCGNWLRRRFRSRRGRESVLRRGCG